MMKKDLGEIREGWLADLLLVDGDPLSNISVLQDQSKLLAIMKDGEFAQDAGDPLAAQPSSPRTLNGTDHHLLINEEANLGASSLPLLGGRSVRRMEMVLGS